MEFLKVIFRIHYKPFIYLWKLLDNLFKHFETNIWSWFIKETAERVCGCEINSFSDPKLV